MNWRKWNAGKQKRSERAQKAAVARWERHHAALASEPVRVDAEPRICQIRLAALGEPTLCLVAVARPRRQWDVAEQGQPWGRQMGAWAIGRAVGRWLAGRGLLLSGAAPSAPRRREGKTT